MESNKCGMEFCKSITKLSGESDWPIWKRKVRDILEFYEGALEIIERKLTKPIPLVSSATESQRQAYQKQCDLYRKAYCYAKNVITSTITDEVYQKVMDKESALEIWQALKLAVFIPVE